MLFPNTTQNNPGMNPAMNTGQNMGMFPINQPILSNETIVQQYCQRDILEKFKFIYDSLYHENFQNIVPFLDQNQNSVLKQLE